MIPMLERLLKYPHTPFDKSSHERIALRVQHPDIFRWRVSNRVLSVSTEAWDNFIDFDLSALTMDELANALASAGFQIVYQDAELSGRSAAILLSGSGLESQSNGDALKAYDTLLWSLFDSYAIELESASAGIDQAMLQMYLDTADGEWLDYWGEYFGFPREGRDDAQYRAYIIAETLRPRNNALAIENTIEDLAQEDVRIREPWKDIFVLGESRLNDRYHLHGAHYYMFATIQPVGNVGVDWNKVIPLIRRNKAGGVFLAEQQPIVPPAHIDADIPDSSASMSEIRTRAARIKMEMDPPLDVYRLDHDGYIKNHRFMIFSLMGFASDAPDYVVDIPSPRTIAKAAICLSDSWVLGDINSVLGRGRIIRIMSGMTLSGGVTEEDDLKLSDGKVAVIFDRVEEITEDLRTADLELLPEPEAGVSVDVLHTSHNSLSSTNNPAAIELIYVGATVYVDPSVGRGWTGAWDSATWIEDTDDFLIIHTPA